MSEDKEGSTGKKINEVRKKISLCEGKRRAFFHTGIFSILQNWEFSLHQDDSIIFFIKSESSGWSLSKNILKIPICAKFDNVNMGIIMLQNEPRVLYLLIKIDTIICSWKGEKSK